MFENSYYTLNLITLNSVGVIKYFPNVYVKNNKEILTLICFKFYKDFILLVVLNSSK